MKGNGKSKKIIYVIILTLILLIIALVIYKISTKSREVDTNENINTNIEEIAIMNESESTNSEDLSIELNKNDDIVKELAKKLDFKTYAIASIYKVKYFNLDTIPNDLILRLAWANIDKNDKVIEDDKQIATKETLNNSVKNIFGTKTKYSDNTFTNIDVLKFSGYNENIGDITYADNKYIANYVEGGGGDTPFIYQYIDKAIKNKDEIKIYVKTAFVDITSFNEAQYEYTYTIYKNFDNEKSEFSDKVTDIISTDFYNKNSTDGYTSITLNNNEEITNNLNSYVYTFKLDGSDVAGNYYLYGFSKLK